VATRAELSRVLIETLGRLHAIDPAAVGLEGFGKPAGYLERQVSRWWQQWEFSKTRELPQMEELKRRLTAGLPEQGAPGIVHGDYRLDNVIFAPADPSRICAILDWEMCTQGDPLADVGLLMVYWSDRSDPADLVAGMALAPITQQDGFLTRDELVRAYDAVNDRDLSRLDWYTCLGYYKLAIVAEGIHARFLMGQTVGEGFDLMGPRVPLLVNHALDLAAGSGLPGLSGLQVLAHLKPAAVSPAVVFLASDAAPTRAILCAGAGSFERAYITLTPGAFIGSGQDAADRLAAKIETISSRKSDIVPDSAMDQGRIEITNAQAAAG